MSANQLTARCRLWLLKAYLHDLEEYKAGDVNRFGRMVGSGGVSLGSEAGWRALVKALIADDLLQAYYPAELAECAHRFQTMEGTR